ncbi:MAG: O-acetyl-ADP-ribose deacetylase [Peptococcaceae bacterium]|nr:O-acetyl-ADP-ribose deacetylase [Peptococcaceae bacterium]
MFKAGSTKVVLIQGDITRQDTEAIVNAANSSLLGGGGVDGAIHRAGGPQILEECKQIRARQGGCPAGEAVITGGGNLKARYVIHTVGPVWSGGGSREDELLSSAYRNSLQLAVSRGIRSVSFPSISTGAYGFPTGRAARVAASTVKNFLEREGGLDEVRFVLFSEKDFNTYREAWEELTAAGD